LLSANKSFRKPFKILRSRMILVSIFIRLSTYKFYYNYHDAIEEFHVKLGLAIAWNSNGSHLTGLGLVMIDYVRSQDGSMMIKYMYTHAVAVSNILQKVLL